MMKRTILLSLAALCCALTAAAQDLIVKTDAAKIEAKVIEITPEAVRYKRFSNPDGPTYVLPVAQIHYIQYANGEKEYYTKTIPATPLTPATPTVPATPATPAVPEAHQAQLIADHLNSLIDKIHRQFLALSVEWFLFTGRAHRSAGTSGPETGWRSPSRAIMIRSDTSCFCGSSSVSRGSRFAMFSSGTKCRTARRT